VKVKALVLVRVAAVPSREGFVLEAVHWDVGTARLLPAFSRAVLAARVRHPPQARSRRGRQPARHLPGHRARPPLPRAGPDASGRARGPWAASRARAGTSWVAALRSDPTGEGGRDEPAHADGEVPAQEGGERTEGFPPSPEATAAVTSLLAPGDRRR
jgi:hypothetical protein